MTDLANPRLSAWESFSVIVGSSGAALIGVQFVVITLVAWMRRRPEPTTISAFATPTVVHLAGALFISAIMSAPWPSLALPSVTLAVWGFGGLAYGATVILRARRQTGYRPVREDWLWYAILPCTAYTALALGAALLTTTPQTALIVIAAAALAMLLIGIRNAWDSVTTHRGRRDPGASADGDGVTSRRSTPGAQSPGNAAGREAHMRIGILGSGLMGGKLGTLFVRAGHDVVFSYARSERKLKRLAREAQGKARAGTPGEAAREADVLLLAVHWSRVDDVLRQAGDLAGKVIVTCSLPMNAGDTDLVIANTSSGAEALARKVRRARVVSAFGTVPSEVLFDVFEARRRANRPSLLYCGDHQRAKESAAELIRDVGFDPVDAGPLRVARYTEPFGLLVAQLAYEREGGPELAYRFVRLGN